MVKYVLAILGAFAAGTLLAVFTYFVFLADIQLDPLANLGRNNSSIQNGGGTISHVEYEDSEETMESASHESEKWELAFYLFPDMDDIVNCATPFTGYTPGGSEIVFTLELNLAPDGTISGSEYTEYSRSNVHIEGNGTFVDQRLELTGEFEREDNTEMSHTNTYHSGTFNIVGDRIDNITFNLDEENSGATLVTDYELERGDWETGSCTYQSPELQIHYFSAR